MYINFYVLLFSALADVPAAEKTGETCPPTRTHTNTMTDVKKHAKVRLQYSLAAGLALTSIDARVLLCQDHQAAHTIMALDPDSMDTLLAHCDLVTMLRFGKTCHEARKAVDRLTLSCSYIPVWHGMVKKKLCAVLTRPPRRLPKRRPRICGNVH